MCANHVQSQIIFNSWTAEKYNGPFSIPKWNLGFLAIEMRKIMSGTVRTLLKETFL